MLSNIHLISYIAFNHNLTLSIVILLIQFIYERKLMKSVLILGGGFAGIEAAIYLKTHIPIDLSDDVIKIPKHLDAQELELAVKLS